MNLKAKCVWQEGFKSCIDNTRGHSVNIDLPENKGGNDSGPMALELTVMSLGGCIVTIFALLARKMKIDFTSLSCEVQALIPDKSPTITKCDAKVKIKSDADTEKIELCIEKTKKICPVGVIFENANIEVETTLEKLR